MNSTSQSQRRREQIILIASDYIGLVLSFFIMHSLRFQTPTVEFLMTTTFSGMTFIMLFYQYIMNLYEPWGWRSKLFSPFRSAYSATGMAITIVFIVYILSLDSRGLIGRGVLIAGIFIFYLISLVFRYGLLKLYVSRIKSKWLILLKNGSMRNVESELGQANSHLTIDTAILESNSDGALFLPENKLSVLNQHWDGIVVESKLAPDMLRRFMQLRMKGIEILTLDRFFELFFDKVPIHFIDRSWFAFGVGFQLYQRRVHKRIKRALDILISSIVLLLTAPVILITVLAIRLESKGGVIYCQKRVGENGNIFTMFKFRSMVQNAESDGAQWAAKNDNRVTLVGHVLRLTRIDELPQLINVLRGDMSFIGPRPERPEFTDLLREKIPFYDIRHTVKPGLTGWAQIHYPYGASIEDAVQKLQYEIYYIKNYSILLDLKIMAKTLQVILFAKGR